MGFTDSSPNSSKLALVPGGSGLVDVHTSFTQIVVGGFGIVYSLDSKKGLTGSLSFSVPTEASEFGFDP